MCYVRDRTKLYNMVNDLLSFISRFGVGLGFSILFESFSTVVNYIFIRQCDICIICITINQWPTAIDIRNGS